MAKRRYRERRRSPARRRATREARRRILVVCEGEVTEPDYLRGFERWARTTHIEIKILTATGNSKTFVEKAVREKTKATDEAKRTGDPNLAYEEVWCVFDRDEHAYFPEAILLAKDQGVFVAVSNPCFELWLLLHIRESPGARSAQKVQALVKKHIPGYSKRVDFQGLKNGYPEAVARARRLDEEARKAAESNRNPTTGVYRLTESIRGNLQG